jgi:hypothetical protein
MKTGGRTPSLEAIEHAVLERARASLPLGSSGLEANLRAVHERILALPLTGLPEIELPDMSPAGTSGADLGDLSPSGSGEGFDLTGAGIGDGVLPLSSAPGASGLSAAGASLPMAPWISGAAVKAWVVGVTVATGAAFTVPRLSEDAPRKPASSEETRAVSAAAPLSGTAAPTILGNDARGPEPSFEEPSAAAPARGGLTQAISARPLEGAAPLRQVTKAETTSHETASRETTPPSPVSELTALKEAQRRLRLGDATGALQELGSVNRKFPQGNLVPERRVTELLALCALGRVAEARVIGRKLEGMAFYNVYRARLEKSCAPPTQ